MGSSLFHGAGFPKERCRWTGCLLRIFKNLLYQTPNDTCSCWGGGHTIALLIKQGAAVLWKPQWLPIAYSIVFTLIMASRSSMEGPDGTFLLHFHHYPSSHLPASS